MSETVAPVDYDNHPGFTVSSAPWLVNEEDVSRFSFEYMTLLSTGQTEGDVLIDTARSIFRQLEAQTSDAHEHRFVTELGTDVIGMVSEQINFYQRMAVAKPRPDGQSEHQRALITDGFYLTSISPETLAKIQAISKSALEMLVNVQV